MIDKEVLEELLEIANEPEVKLMNRRIFGRKSHPKFKLPCEYCGKEKIVKLKDLKLDDGRFMPVPFCNEHCIIKYNIQEELIGNYHDYESGFISKTEMKRRAEKIKRSYLRLVKNE